MVVLSKRLTSKDCGWKASLRGRENSGSISAESMTNLLLQYDEMYDALRRQDIEYDGFVFFGVATTGFFCRPGCASKTPGRDEVSFFDRTSDALKAGFRPCKRCQPMQVAARMPLWLETAVNQLDADPEQIWLEQERQGVDPRTVRSWFLNELGVTLHSYLRSHRLVTALGKLALGRTITETAKQAGFETVAGFRSAFQRCLGFEAELPRESDSILVNQLETPLGPMVVACTSEQLVLLEFSDRKLLATQFQRLQKLTSLPVVPGENRLMNSVQQQLELYFEGELFRFSLPLLIRGTRFQETVWRQLLELEFGQAVSYETIARQIDSPQAQRAVGRANGDNRIAIVIPCHRVIRQDGKRSGYGGGVRRKEWMLEHENAIQHHRSGGDAIRGKQNSTG